MNIGRREALRIIGLGTVGLAVFYREAASRSNGDPKDLTLFYREQGIFNAKLSSILSSQTGRDVSPYIRREPSIGAEPVKISNLQAHGIDVSGSSVVRGFKVWGGTYPSSDGRGMALTREGRIYGKWLAIVDGEGKVVGFVAENFVTYLPPKNSK